MTKQVGTREPTLQLGHKPVQQQLTLDHLVKAAAGGALLSATELIGAKHLLASLGQRDPTSLMAAYQDLREVLPAQPQGAPLRGLIAAFLAQHSKAHLAYIDATLKAGQSLGGPAAVRAELEMFTRAPMPRDTQSMAAQMIAQLDTRSRKPAYPNPAITQLAGQLPMHHVRKDKRAEVTKKANQKLRARSAERARQTEGFILSTEKDFGTFWVAGRPDLTGWCSPTITMGTHSKIKLLRTNAGETFVARMGRTSGDAAGIVGTVASVLVEAEALQAVGSTFAPVGKLWDEKGRFYDIIRRVDGDVFDLVDQAPQAVQNKEFVATLLMQVFGELAKARTAGILHRDVKLENVLWSRDGSLGLADWGLAQKSRPGLDASVGTPDCLAPEFVTHPEQAADHSDLYSVGCMMVDLLAPHSSGSFPLDIADPNDHRVLEVYSAWLQYRGRLPPFASQRLKEEVRRVESAFQEISRVDPAVAELVFLRLLNPEPKQRGEAIDHLSALEARFGSPAILKNFLAPRLAAAAATNALTTRMDATSRDLAEFEAAMGEAALEQLASGKSRP